MINKIDDNDIKDYLHENQPNVPKKSAFDMKRFLDHIPKNIIIPKLNELIDFLNNRLTGRKTEFNGEVFNDYKNNKAIADFTRASASHSQAGALGYTVIAYDYDKKTFTLDNATGLQEAVDKKLSYCTTIVTNTNTVIYANFTGKVTKVEGNVVTVSAMPAELKNTTLKEVDPYDNDYNIDFEQNSFFIPRLPLAGHRPLGACSSDDGFRCITTAKYGRATGDTCGVFAQAGDAGCKDCEVWAVGGFARNIGNIANGKAQAIFGEYNALDPNAYFIIGNGTSKTNRSNLFKIMKDGSIWVNGNTISDYVIEEGTSGNWTYRKWKNGKVELWGHRLTGETALPFSISGNIQVFTAPFYNNEDNIKNTHNAYIVGGTACKVLVYNWQTDNRVSSFNTNVYIVGKWK